MDQLGKVQPDTRNPVIALAMEVLHLTENRYSGIPTIQRAMSDFGLRPPVFSSARGTFTVVLYNNVIPAANGPSLLGGLLTDKEEELIRFLKVPRTRQEIADHLRIGTVQYAIQAYIRPLIEKGRVKMTIPERPRSQSQKYYTADYSDD